MRGYFIIVGFVTVGLITALFIAVGIEESRVVDAVDYEMDGLNDKYVIKFPHVVARNTPKDQGARYFAELVKEKSDGWLEIQIIPNGAAYKAQEEFEALKRNEVQMIAPGMAEVAVRDPKWNVLDLPYLFKREDTYTEAFEGQVGRFLFNSIGQKGYIPLAFWNNGFRQITNNVRPIVRPEDLKDLKIRAMPGESLFETYSSLGAEPVNYPFNTVHQVLSENKVDGTENTLSNIYSKGFDLHQEYLTISNHNYLGYVVLTNHKFWSSLPLKYQKIIEEAMLETTEWIKNESKHLNDEMLEKIIERDKVEITYLSEEEQDRWRRRLISIYEIYEPIVGKEIMNEIRELQKEEVKKIELDKLSSD